MTAEECVEALKNQKLRKIDDLPHAVGVYALTDHLGDIHYIGITATDSFRDRIYSRHVNGSEERSHKLACNYNIGRMWRDRKSADHVPHNAKIAKDLSPFANCHAIVCYGGAGLFDKHLASTIHCVDDDNRLAAAA